MTMVVDSSVVTAALLPGRWPVGGWTEACCCPGPLAGPHLLPAEVAKILRVPSLQE